MLEVQAGFPNCRRRRHVRSSFWCCRTHICHCSPVYSAKRALYPVLYVYLDFCCAGGVCHLHGACCVCVREGLLPRQCSPDPGSRFFQKPGLQPRGGLLFYLHRHGSLSFCWHLSVLCGTHKEGHCRICRIIVAPQNNKMRVLCGRDEKMRSLSIAFFFII